MKLRIVLMLCFVLHTLQAAERVMVYSHYDYSPFWRNAEQGLSIELVKELTARSAGLYIFQIQVTPRKRIDAILENPKWQGIVPWVTPQWFRDDTMSRFAWSHALMHDADLVLSHQSALHYEDATSLYGLHLGGILGHRYAEAEEAISAGRLFRDDALNQESNIKKLMANRVDVIFIPHSAWVDLKIRSPEQIQGLYIASRARNVYDRKILLSPNNPKLIQYVQKVVDDLAMDVAWQKKISPYHYFGK